MPSSTPATQQTSMVLLSQYAGPFSSQTRLSPRLRFLETYTSTVDAAPVHPLSSIPPTRYYLPSATFYNTNGVNYHTADAIWTWMTGLFAPLEYIHHDNISLIEFERSAVDANTGVVKKQWLIHNEAVRCLRMKGWESQGREEVRIPIFLAFVIEEAEEGEGIEGLAFKEAHIWWDEKVLGDAFSASK